MTTFLDGGIFFFVCIIFFLSFYKWMVYFAGGELAGSFLVWVVESRLLSDCFCWCEDGRAAQGQPETAVVPFDSAG